MIKYKSCDEVATEDAYIAFGRGFSDYVVPFDMPYKDFVDRFFGPEGNALEISFIAYDEEEPIGLVLSGIRQWDGMKTIRCGILCIAPGYRGKGVAQKLYALHKEVGQKQGCKQMFLEVIKSNDRAICFYKKLNYMPVYDLKYYTIETSELKESCGNTYEIATVNYETLRAFRNKQDTLHINWQSDVESYSGGHGYIYLSAQNESSIRGIIAMNPVGRIDFLWVDPKCRMKGLGRQLVKEAAIRLGLTKVRTTVSSNALYEGFLRRLNFHKEDIEQYEMYLPL